MYARVANIIIIQIINKNENPKRENKCIKTRLTNV